MKNERSSSELDQIPKAVATELLLSKQKMSSQFKKNCRRARETVVAPVSRSTQLAISAPKTDAQRLAARLGKLNARQLQLWAKRTLRRGNRLRDALDAVEYELDDSTPEQIELLTQAIARHDALCEAINAELDNRAKRGKLCP